jgi:hypothetical protein
MVSFPRLFVAATLTAALSNAQTGVLDQTSPFAGGSQTSWFNVDASSLVWQAQVRVGVAGPLEGVKLQLDGAAGAQANVRVRVGDGWNASAVVFQTQLTKTSPALEDVFVDMQSANLSFAVGATFVIELQGNDTGCGVRGTYVIPSAGGPLYPEPLFLGGPGCFADCGWRIGFETYVVVATPPTTYCTAGTTTNGCVPSIGGTGTPSWTGVGSFDIRVTDVETQKVGLVFWSLSGANAAPWAGGASTSFFCVKPPVIRTPSQGSGGVNPCEGEFNVDWNAYAQFYPNPPPSGQPVWAQAWFRDPSAPGTTNLSNGLRFVP